MSNKACGICKWYRQTTPMHGVCMNPCNDELFDYFNTGTGDVTTNLRRVANVGKTEVCEEFTPQKPGKTSK
jgi:hypothetical protein